MTGSPLPMPLPAMNAAPALLAFDTSTETLAVAACGAQGNCLLNLPGGAAASAQLLPQIDIALAATGLALGDLAAIAFGRGPGAFTGLRTSCAVAQGLALGLSRPVLPLDSLMVVAEDALAAFVASWSTRPARPAQPLSAVRVAVAMDARMDEIYGAVYERRDRGSNSPGDDLGALPWHTLRAPALFTLAAWNAVLDEHAGDLQGVAGSALGAFGTRLHSVAAATVWPAEQNRAAALLRLAQWAWRAGAAVDAAHALPTYLRDKVALTTREREVASAVAGAAAGAAAAVGANR